MKGGEKMISPVSFSLVPLAPTTAKQEEKAFGFATLLADMKQGMLLQEAGNSTADLPLISSSELHSKLQQFFDSIPVDEGYVRQETLDEPIVGKLLKRLPPTWKEQVVETFVPGRSVEQLMEDEKALENNGTLLAVALMLFQLEQRQLSLPPFALEGLQQQITTIFPANETIVLSHEGNKNMRVLLDKLSRSLPTQNQAAAVLLPNEFAKTAIHARPSLQPMLVEQQKQEAPLFHEAVVSAVVDNEELANTNVANREKELVLSLSGGKTWGEHTIILPSNTAKSDMQHSFVHQLTEIMKAGKFTKNLNGQSQLVIRLHPEHLGTLTIKLIAQKDGALAAKIVTNTTAAKELVEASIHQIRHIIPTENIIVERFDVWTQHEFDGMNRHQQQHQSRQPFEQEKHAEKQERATEEFADTLQEELNTTI